MNYRQTTKPQKQKIPHLISLDLIRGKHFKEIVNIVHEQSVLTNRDRYIYGYSLLQLQQNLQALVTLWPLAAKDHIKLQEDCAIIAAHVFKDEHFLATIEGLSEKTLYALFLIAQKLIPQTQVYAALKQHLFDLLWQKHDYEQLERILKASKKEWSGILVENLSKLVFFQPENKLVGNISAFVGCILTGGACLILRNSIYHSDIAEEIRFLANEIKILFSRLEIKNQQKLSWDKALFESFLDYEVDILTQVLQLAVDSRLAGLDIIPTPSYLINYDAATGRLGQNFLPWLAVLNQELCEMYHVNIYHAVIWVLGGDKLSMINNILKLTTKDQFHPYLRLALMLRAANIKKGSLSRLVQISDFENLIEPINLFRNVAIQTVYFIVNKTDQINITAEFWRILFKFYPVLQDPAINNILIKKSIQVLYDEHKDRKNLNLCVIKSIARQTNDHKFEKQIDLLCSRQQDCLQFLLTLNDNKKSKKTIKEIKKNELALHEHLALIADSCFLVAAELSEEFFQHIKNLVTNKEINKLIRLKDFFDFNCECPKCKQYLYNHTISYLVEKLNLSVASIPEVHLITNLQHNSKGSPSKLSILSHPDPFTVLDVAIFDSKQTIMQKVMKLIQQNPDKMAIFRQAQSELFNPAQRFLHHYFRYLSYEDQNIVTEVWPLSHLMNFSLHSISIREELLNEK